MEFDQVIFQRIYNFLAKKKKGRVEASPHQVLFSDIRNRLLILARAISGDAVDLLTSEREGGWKDDTLYLPANCSLYESLEQNANFYLYRVFYLCTQRSLGFNWASNEQTNIASSQAKALGTSSTVITKMLEEFPLLEPVITSLKRDLENDKDENQPEVDYSWLYGRWMKNSASYEQKKQLENVSDHTFGANSVKAETEIKAKQADEVEVLVVDKKAQEDYTLTHNFEKVETVEEFDGNWRDFDGDNTLSDDAQALSDYNLKHVVRVDDPVHSVYQAEMVGNVTISESAEVNSNKYCLTYPEWDYTKSSYKTDFCKVYPESLTTAKPDYFHKTMSLNRPVFAQLRKVFARINNDWEYVRRQVTGDHIDLDAATDRFADLCAKHTPDDKIYISSRKQRKELSLLFLLDLSLSSDGYAKGNRIIDIEKQVSILFGEVLNEYEIDFQIDGFYSKTRNMTSYITLKSFDQPWSKARLNIGAVQPEGYTRIGPAIRHAHHLLGKRSNRKKWLILLSDGKPNDYDRYEGKYGIKDIKQALRELSADGINSYAVAIEEQAKYYLPQMFGNNHYNILSSPVEMVTSLAKLYKRIESTNA